MDTVGKAGASFDSKQVLEDQKKSYPYFRVESGRDELVCEGEEQLFPFGAEPMSIEETKKVCAQAGLDDARDEIRARRQECTKENKKTWDRINSEHPEFEEYGYWEEYEVDGCPEEPDAPKVHVLVRRLRNDFKKGPYPVVIPVACGGLFLNDPHMFSNAPITKYLGCELVVPELRVFPDAEYPAAINDLHATYQWMIKNAEALDIDTDRIVLEGVSTGGNLAAALAFRLKRYDWCGGPMPRGVAIFDGSLDDRGTTRSARIINKGWDGLMDRAANMLYMGKNFASDFVGPEAYANHATVEECKGMPPFAIFANQDYPGCDSSMEFMRKLSDAGDYVSFMMGGTCADCGPAERLSRVDVFSIRDCDYVPQLGVGRLDVMESFFVGNIKDFLAYDLRRDYE
jgi:acetyl esterase/lipase